MENVIRLAVLAAAGWGAGLMGCAGAVEPGEPIRKSAFGTTPDGTDIELYTLRNSRGMEARITTYGGALVSLKTPDKHGNLGDIVLGYESVEGYFKGKQFFGGLIGRCGNRIAKGRFSIDGREYQVTVNNGPNSLHGGPDGFDRVVWRATARRTPQGPALLLDYLAKDGEEGYPGNLSVTAVYALTEENELKLDFTATADRDTICNLTQHAYFNLRGSGDILGHVLQINADKFTPVDETLIPTGELRAVAETPFDFREPRAIGLMIDAPDGQLKFGNGYDHNLALNKPAGGLDFAARVWEPESGRVLEIFSTAPGMQFYSGNYISGGVAGRGGRPYGRREGFCLEPQGYPDAVNHPDFPTVVLRARREYKHSIVYKCLVRDGDD